MRRNLVHGKFLKKKKNVMLFSPLDTWVWFKRCSSWFFLLHWCACERPRDSWQRQVSVFQLLNWVIPSMC